VQRCQLEAVLILQAIPRPSQSSRLQNMHVCGPEREIGNLISLNTREKPATPQRGRDTYPISRDLSTTPTRLRTRCGEHTKKNKGEVGFRSLVASLPKGCSKPVTRETDSEQACLWSAWPDDGSATES
jgi:hypothetical protein